MTYPNEVEVIARLRDIAEKAPTLRNGIEATIVNYCDARVKMYDLLNLFKGSEDLEGGKEIKKSAITDLVLFLVKMGSEAPPAHVESAHMKLMCGYLRAMDQRVFVFDTQKESMTLLLKNISKDEFKVEVGFTHTFNTSRTAITYQENGIYWVPVIDPLRVSPAELDSTQTKADKALCDLNLSQRATDYLLGSGYSRRVPFTPV